MSENSHLKLISSAAALKEKRAVVSKKYFVRFPQFLENLFHR
jgi:hypothetical protein